MLRIIWGAAIAVLVAVGVSTEAIAQAKKPTAPAVRLRLPRDHEYQRVLIRHLERLTEKDFTHGVTGKLPVQQSSARDEETLYRNYILTLMNQPLVGTKRGPPAINAPARLFLLSNIESPAGAMKPPVWPETLISFAQWDYEGNIYRDNRALKLRAFVTAALMMIMLDADFDDHPEAGRADHYAYHLVYIALPYGGFKDVLPADVQQAYLAGLRRMGERVLGWGVRWEDPQSDLIAPFGLWCVAKQLDDPAFGKRVEAFARKLYTDPQYYNLAGCWTYYGGIDVSYNGQANWFAVTTGLATGWPFVKQAVDRNYRLRGHLILPEPDGRKSGPSHFNTRLSGPVSVDQWAWGNARDIAAAMLTDEAAHLVPMPTSDELRKAPGARAGIYNYHIAENPIKTGNGSAEKPYVNLKNDEIGSYPWSRRPWVTYNFPASVNPGYEFYRSDALARRRELQRTNPQWLKSPFERGESFVRVFEKDFVVCRQPGFAAILHVGTIGAQNHSPNSRELKGPPGLSGGQLSAFWTPATGSVLLGQRGGMTRGSSFDVVEAWRTWPNHSVNGVTSDGVFFTSAAIRKPETIITTGSNSASVKVSDTIPSQVIGQAKSIRGKYAYSRSFQIDSQGVHVKTSVRGQPDGDESGGEKISELYETLPVYLRDAQQQSQAEPTKIEFQVEGRWINATDSFTVAVQAVRLTRFQGSVLITFDRPRRVKLSPADWSDKYISRGTARNVLVDLLETGDVATRLIDTKQIAYRIAASPK